MASEFQVLGNNPDALFTLKLHRGESMVLLGMNWKDGKPPMDFVGFAIEYMEPGGQKFFPLTNRLSFPGLDGNVNAQILSTRLSPIQKFRWVHFPRNAELQGVFHYRVTPVFMNEHDELSYGHSQEASIELGLDTYEGKLNVAFTRGFVSSQAFVDRCAKDGLSMSDLFPSPADATKAKGLDFKPANDKAQEALAWMGFEARNAILGVLDEALADKTSKVKVIAYDLNEPEVVSRLEQLGNRLQVIIDDSGSHGENGSAENEAELRLKKSAGESNVARQHMLDLQHNKTIVVRGDKCQAVVCGSTNFSRRAFFVQANNAVVLRGQNPAAIFAAAFEAYWPGDAKQFQASPATGWTSLHMPGLDAEVTFSPHSKKGAVLGLVADEVKSKVKGSVLFSLAFLYQTKGALFDAINDLTKEQDVFVYGMSDRQVGGLDLDTADGHMELTEPDVLAGNVPEPFKSEPTGGSGIRMHHKFIIVDFNTPDARVYMGSFNFSDPADVKNGENLLVFKDQRVATAYMVEALRLFDHYEFRVKSHESTTKGKPLTLSKSPRSPFEKPWWDRYWSEPMRAKDRALFA